MWKENKKKEQLAKERARVQKLFDDIDEDGGGTLDREEVGILLVRLSGGEVPEPDLESAMQELDADGDGKLTSSPARECLVVHS